ncbi:hypothetical protein [Mesorhizobium sp. B2-5-8]|uniref:hypothetical protein n=1 Tax=unclassified Mesorhizobium TaxID=325217 RepID=UPI0015E2DD97|nr:hypothetical protein [Mesorhizobium sp. B2-5-8]
MLLFLQNLHLIATKRGDGLRPEFLSMEGEAGLGMTFPCDRVIPAQCMSEQRSAEPPTPRLSKGVAKACRPGTPSR